MTDKEIEEQLKALEEKLKLKFPYFKDLGDDSVILIPENSYIRISKHDLRVAYDQFLLKKL